MHILHCVHHKSTKHCNSFACHCIFLSCHVSSLIVSFLHWMLFSHNNIPHLSRSPLVTILPRPSMGFYGPCSLKDTINTALFCTMYFKLDLRSSALQSSPVTLNSTLRPQGITRPYYSSTIRVQIVPNASHREVHCWLSLSRLLLGRTSVSLWVSPVQVAFKIGL